MSPLCSEDSALVGMAGTPWQSAWGVPLPGAPHAGSSHALSFLSVSEVPVREESDTEQTQSDDGDPEGSPTKSPTTPQSVKSKNSSGGPTG